MTPEIEAALRSEKTVDIITTGRKSGQPQKIEIWYFYTAGKYIITGTPGPRGWYANLLADPALIFCLKGEVKAELQALAIPVLDREDRQHIFSTPETSWYRSQVSSISELINDSPLVEIRFEEVT
jgi:hypothetical protein